MAHSRAAAGNHTLQELSVEHRAKGAAEEREVPVIKINVGSATLTAATFVQLVTELICFVLYMHQQMPCTYEQLGLDCMQVFEGEPRQVDASKSSCSKAVGWRQAYRLKKLVKLKIQIQKLLLALQTGVPVFREIRSLLVILGPNFARPKQTYEVHSLCPIASTSCDPGQNQPSKIEDLSRKLIRALIADGANYSSEGSTKLFIMIRASASSPIQEDFCPKRGIVLKSKRLLKTSIHLLPGLKANLEQSVGSISIADKESQNKWEQVVATDEEYVWFQCQHTVKGLVETTSADVE